MIKIGILGGTFNPPHKGHLYMAEKMLEEFSLDKILLLPSGMPPHKSSSELADKSTRKEMLKILSDGISRLEVCETELNRESYTYTVDTLTEFSNTYKQDELFYLIGSDTLFLLESWRNFKRVAELTYFICLPRPEENIEGTEALSNIRLKAKELEQKYGTRIFVSRNSGPEISSSMIRRSIKAGESIDGLLPKELEEYIIKNSVYD